MTKLLYLKASPRGAESKSAAVADAYLAALRAKESRIDVDVLDLSTEWLPEFDGDKVAAKMKVILGQSHDRAEKTAWEEICEIAQRFMVADIYLIAAPMWNGGVPYRLKQYIDIIHQPGLLWTLDPEKGYSGLLQGRRAVLALTSGAYGPEMPSPAYGVDHHSTYLRAWLNQAGVTDIEELRFQPTLLAADPVAGLNAAIEAAKGAAAAGS